MITIYFSTAKFEIDFLLWWLDIISEGWGRAGVVQKFLRHKIDRSYGYICSEYKLFYQ